MFNLHGSVWHKKAWKMEKEAAEQRKKPAILDIAGVEGRKGKNLSGKNTSVYF